MKEYAYGICGIPLRISLPDEVEPVGAIEPFRRETPPEPGEVRYTAKWYSGLPEDVGTIVNRQPGYRIRQTGDGYRYEFNVGYEMNPYCLLLDMDPGGQGNTLWLPEAHGALLREGGLPVAQNLGQDLLFLPRDRILMHASLVRYRGQGILFTGPSGMGKSTQAGLWQRCFGAEVLNGDKTVLHLAEEGTWAWGSPYAGTSGIYRNESAKAAGILSLRQGEKNEIRRLRGREALTELLPRMGTAPWAGQWHGRGMALVLALLDRVPVSRLSCRPDPGAAELTYKTLFPQWAETALRETQEDGK